MNADRSNQVSASAPCALELADIFVRFGGIVGLDGVSLRVSQGEVCG